VPGPRGPFPDARRELAGIGELVVGTGLDHVEKDAVVLEAGVHDLDPVADPSNRGVLDLVLPVLHQSPVDVRAAPGGLPFQEDETVLGSVSVHVTDQHEVAHEGDDRLPGDAGHCVLSFPPAVIERDGHAFLEPQVGHVLDDGKRDHWLLLDRFALGRLRVTFSAGGDCERAGERETKDDDPTGAHR
jgi:hypothetical protein